MVNLLNELRRDETGLIVSGELVMIVTIGVLAMVVGIHAVAGSINSERIPGYLDDDKLPKVQPPRRMRHCAASPAVTGTRNARASQIA